MQHHVETDQGLLVNKWVEVERQLTGVWVRPELVTIAGSLAAGVLLSQIVYWFRPGGSGKRKLRVKREGLFWLAKRRVDWAKECGLSPRQYDTAIAKLIKLEVVEAKIFHFAGHPTTHIRILEQGLEKLCKSQIGDLHITEVGNPNHESVIPYTETTDIDYEQIKADATTVAAVEQQIGVKEQMPHKLVEEAREIDDWMAERPVLAEQKAGKFTAREWLTKAQEILKSCQGKMGLREVRLAANSLSMAWKRMAAEEYGGDVKELTNKEIGQLKMYLQKAGEQAPQVMEFAIREWGGFAFKARCYKGLSTAPDRPAIGFLLQHYDVAMNMQLIAKSVAQPAKKFCMPEIPKKTVVHEKPMDIATLEDVMAALAEYG